MNIANSIKIKNRCYIKGFFSCKSETKQRRRGTAQIVWSNLKKHYKKF